MVCKLDELCAGNDYIKYASRLVATTAFLGIAVFIVVYREYSRYIPYMYQRSCEILKDASFFLFGARGVGKTWLLEREFKDKSILWINLLRNGDFLKYQSKPELLRAELKELATKQNSSKEPSWVIIDEVQRVPQLLNEVHALIEDREFRNRFLFGLSGSSARKLKRGGANLLAGRALLNYLYPLTAKELDGDFDLNQVLSWGALPGVISESNTLIRSERLEAYVAVYLREEVKEEQLVRNLDPFIRFIAVAAQASGQIINYSKIGKDCGIDSRAVARYFQILEETLLGFFLPPFNRSVRKQQGKSPKFYFFDNGVIRALEGNLRQTLEASSYGYGRLFEHFVIWEIIKSNQYYRTSYKFSYLITKDGAEIDLIVEQGNKKTILIEIKSGTNPQLADAKHLRSLRKDFPNSESWLVSQIETERSEDGVRFLHWKTMLAELYSVR